MCKIKNSARLIVGFMIMFLVCYSHGNSWNVLNSGQTGGRSGGSIVYEPDSSRFFLVLGTSDDSSAYSDLVYSDRLGKWINNFPHDTLYGVWGDSIGKTKGLGRMGNAVFSNGYYFGFQNISWGGKTFLRPNLHENRRSYMQYAYNSIDKKIYAHYKGITCTYNTKTRIWDTISALPNPSSYGSAAYSRFGFMAHDPVNNEIIFAGGAIDKRDGWSGVWKLSVATRSWSKQNATVEPGPRAYASVATDPVRGKIVVFGGDHLDYLMNDTWVYDCASKTWERKRPSLAPSPRAGAAMVYMPKSGKIVLIGGFDYSNCTGYSCPIYRQIPSYEMWTYDIDANTWTLNKKFLSSERIPTVRIPDVPTAAADTSDRILLFGHSRDT
ncbi:MAG: hypothetical protein JNL74_12260, partial [Fibrobacteres bacterium]|nr:hypothetical protein [Fibrobacterota bacterium]